MSNFACTSFCTLKLRHPSQVTTFSVEGDFKKWWWFWQFCDISHQIRARLWGSSIVRAQSSSCHYCGRTVTKERIRLLMTTRNKRSLCTDITVYGPLKCRLSSTSLPSDVLNGDDFALGVPKTVMFGTCCHRKRELSSFLPPHYQLYINWRLDTSYDLLP